MEHARTSSVNSNQSECLKKWLINQRKPKNKPSKLKVKSKRTQFWNSIFRISKNYQKYLKNIKILRNHKLKSCRFLIYSMSSFFWVGVSALDGPRVRIGSEYRSWTRVQIYGSGSWPRVQIFKLTRPGPNLRVRVQDSTGPNFPRIQNSTSAKIQSCPKFINSIESVEICRSKSGPCTKNSN